MDSLDPTSPKPHGHSRSPSGHERRAAARRYTKGPLDQADVDPLTPQSSRATSPGVRPSMTTSTILSPPPLQPARSPSPRHMVEDISQKDFSPLLRPENFHPIPPNTIPSPFFSGPNAPAADTPLPELLKKGHFYAAAITAASQLIQLTPPYSHDQIFTLLHIRFASLCLLNLTALAASESKILGDLTAPFYRHPLTNAHIVPWDFRVLLVRLQALGFGEWRRGIMSYYVLAGEARAEILRAGKEGRVEEERLWRSRLWELGIAVASALVEMGDAEGAGRHLCSLEGNGDGDGESRRRLLRMEALVWLRLGDVRAARGCLARMSGRRASSMTLTEDISQEEAGNEERFTQHVLSALMATALGDFSAAQPQWRALQSAHPSDATIAQNLAVCLIYTGHMSEAKDLLESLIDSSETLAFQPLLFNLATVYELCTGKAAEAKARLVERIAAKEPVDSGWEKANVEFKL